MSQVWFFGKQAEREICVREVKWGEHSETTNVMKSGKQRGPRGNRAVTLKLHGRPSFDPTKSSGDERAL